MRYYALEHPQADPGAEETLELLGHWAAVQAAQQVRQVAGRSRMPPGRVPARLPLCWQAAALTCNRRLAHLLQGKPRMASARSLRLDDAGWRLLQQPLKLQGKRGSVETKLFDSDEELATARAWLAQYSR